ncbi:flagellar hook-basal body complex protein [Clostridium neonatale]|uniref:Flagellar hook protein FlgE n=1 Tax=Clostridium neonatale TaxID=137838 RepID=A0AAD2DEI9_9CLOT|nr:flagellar hook-basal body complex protein [Clostridium neonatale]CAI3207918.1 flagellar hook protein [Clostridium neonatale]CAI3210293.1 flagellar hook protein [Clostridium neonatale]CAI3213342.1 flagellar hook protein [Clostridium neonatale]CAI3225403.1 flagellar hook protein [Clostridium neonatale]CAI3248443.1 flagellar hook protein [Clostridium neonatale]
MLRSMYSGISGMKVNQTKLDVIGNNIANVSTTAFKGSRAEFKDMLYQNAGYASAPTSNKGGTNAKQIGLGAQLSSINKLMSQGNAMSTGRSLDVCIDGDGYLIVGSGPINAANGVNKDGFTGTNDNGGLEVLYTRDGNLTLDHQGNLLTADGYRVMGYNVGRALTHDVNDGITAKYVNADDKTALTTDGKLVPLAIPDKVGDQPVKTFEIGKDGLITAVLGDGTRSALGQIATGSFKNPEGLTAVGGNLLQVSSNSGSTIVRSGLDKTGTDDNSKGFGDLIQGALEGSNVDLTEQFTDMIVATRAFQASSKMISNGDEVLQTITGLIR